MSLIKTVMEINKLDLMHNHISNYICFDHTPEFIELFLSPQSSLTQYARLKMANTLLVVSEIQKCKKLKALSLLAIGDINKDLKTLQKCLTLYEKTNEETLNN